MSCGNLHAIIEDLLTELVCINVFFMYDENICIDFHSHEIRRRPMVVKIVLAALHALVFMIRVWQGIRFFLKMLWPKLCFFLAFFLSSIFLSLSSRYLCILEFDHYLKKFFIYTADVIDYLYMTRWLVFLRPLEELEVRLPLVSLGQRISKWLVNHIPSLQPVLLCDAIYYLNARLFFINEQIVFDQTLPEMAFT